MSESLKLNNTSGGGTCKHRALILLTGTIDCVSFNRDITKPKINVVLDNTLDRLSQYENVISRYIKESYFTDIVFVENSGYPFPKEKYENLAKEHGKRFEFLYRKLSNEEVSIMQEKGKSWGEADLIDYAMDNSKLIAETEVVYKCTGRIFLKNSKKIIKKTHKNSEFIKDSKYDWVETFFFKVLKQNYYDYLYKVKDEVNDNYFPGHWYDVKCIEVIYCRRIANSNMNVNEFRIYPRLEGMCASESGRRYEKPKLKCFIYDFLPSCLKKRWRIK